MLHFSAVALVIEFWTTELIFQLVLINVTPRKSQYFKVRFIDDQLTLLICNSIRNAVWRHLIHLTGTGIVLEKLTKKLHFLLSGVNKNIFFFFFLFHLLDFTHHLLLFYRYLLTLKHWPFTRGWPFDEQDTYGFHLVLKWSSLIWASRQHKFNIF